jgi:hypothetical protein
MRRAREAQTFLLRDVKRAVSAAIASGIEVGSVRVIPRRNGETSIEIIAAKPGQRTPESDEWETNDPD